MTPATPITEDKTMTAHDINGWRIEKRPNSFAERFMWEATAVDEEGYLTVRVGFNSLREAKVYCNAYNAPTQHLRKLNEYPQ